jgi:enoyl-CoA hydratase/carnithine racemase
MAYETLEVKQDGAIDWLTLNRPQALNALNSTMVSELHDYLERLRSDRTTRVVIVRGAGRAFCSGLDLKEHSGGRPGDDTLGSSTSATLEVQRRISSLVIAIRRLPQPFIAAVRGPASGGGF